MAMVVLRLPDDIVREIRVWCVRNNVKIGELLRAGLSDQCRARGIDVAIPVRGGTDTDQTAET